MQCNVIYYFALLDLVGILHDLRDPAVVDAGGRVEGERVFVGAPEGPFASLQLYRIYIYTYIHTYLCTHYMYIYIYIYIYTHTYTNITITNGKL